MSDDMVLGHMGHSPDFKSAPADGLLDKSILRNTGPATTTVSINTPKKGGDITFQPGPGFNADDGSIILKLNSGQEMIRFDPDGKVYVRGNEVDDDPLIYLAFREWVKRCVKEGPDPTAIDQLGNIDLGK